MKTLLYTGIMRSSKWHTFLGSIWPQDHETF